LDRDGQGGPDARAALVHRPGAPGVTGAGVRSRRPRGAHGAGQPPCARFHQFSAEQSQHGLDGLGQPAGYRLPAHAAGGGRGADRHHRRRGRC
jgi:hypothetical protein